MKKLKHGEIVIITDIHPKDAYYEISDRLIGKKFRVMEIENSLWDGYHCIELIRQNPADEHSPNIYFAGIKVKKEIVSVKLENDHFVI